MTIRLIVFIIVMLTMVLPVEAGRFRKVERIFTPDAAPDGMAPVQKVNPVSRKEIEDAVRDLMNSWNTKDLERWLSDDFYDRTRLLDVIDTDVPRYATLRIMSIEGVQTLNQYVQQDSPMANNAIISNVSATVQIQLEYNDTDSVFQRLDGTFELFFRVTEEMGNN